MSTLWFCVPVYGRLELAAICLRQLRRTCDALTKNGIYASAVLVGDRHELDELASILDSPLGFATVERNNDFLSKKFNDGIQLACDPRYNPRPVDYVVPCGSDDWIDHKILLNLPPADSVLGFQQVSFVREDGLEMTSCFLDRRGGSGIRVYPRQLFEPLGWRPADEDRRRFCDMSILTNVLKQEPRTPVLHGNIDARQIVDWKTSETQLNSYAALRRHRRAHELADPFVALKGIYPDESLHEMRAHYAGARRMVAA